MQLKKKYVVSSALIETSVPNGWEMLIMRKTVYEACENPRHHL